MRCIVNRKYTLRHEWIYVLSNTCSSFLVLETCRHSSWDVIGEVSTETEADLAYLLHEYDGFHQPHVGNWKEHNATTSNIRKPELCMVEFDCSVCKYRTQVCTSCLLFKYVTVQWCMRCWPVDIGHHLIGGLWLWRGYLHLDASPFLWVSFKACP